MQYTKLTHAAKIGTKHHVNGITYIKTSSGKWTIEKTPTIRRWLESLYIGETLTLRDLCKKTGLPHSSAQRLLLDFDLMRSKKKRWTDNVVLVEESADDIFRWNRKEFRSLGYAARKLGQRYGKDLTVSELRRALQRSGIQWLTRKETRFNFLQKNQQLLIELYRDKEYSLSRLLNLIQTKTPKRLGVQMTMLKEFLRSSGCVIRTRDEQLHSMKGKGLIPGSTTAQALLNISSQAFWHYLTKVDPNSLTFDEYKRVVRKLTHAAIKRYPKQYAHVLKRDGYHVDHKYTILFGYYRLDVELGEFVKRNKVVSQNVLAHPENLQLLTHSANVMKGPSCSIPLKRLLNRVEEHAFSIGEYHGEDA